MKNRRISIKVDSEMEDILARHRKKDEADASCFERLVKQVASIAGQLEVINLRAEKTHDETRNMLSEFLKDVKQPFIQINEQLDAINGKIGAGK
ncbi:MAG: hypothetical protein EOP04_09150 [Proteobacteria bacterium]|nr:MAG: hypothetical protein EOP04_09150 [Pseudomonadota bacterium]